MSGVDDFFYINAFNRHLKSSVGDFESADRIERVKKAKRTIDTERQVAYIPAEHGFSEKVP